MSNLVEWQKAFYNSVGKYVNLINIELSKSIPLEPLSNHIKIAGGYAFKSSNYVSEGIPVIRISDFINEQINLENVKFYKESAELNKYELKAGDIVIALTGGTIAKLGIVQEGIGKLYLNQRVGKFEVLNSSEFENEYVYWIARSVQSIIKDLAWGAAIPNVSPKQIEKLKFSFPKKDVQKQIISFLNDLKNDELKDKTYFNSVIETQIVAIQNSQLSGAELNNEITIQLDLVKQLRQAFLREAMQGKLVAQNPDDEPASELLARINAEKEQLIKEKKIKKQKPLPPISEDEFPFEIPESWKWCRLGEIVNLVTSGSRDWAKYYSTSGAIFLRMGNLSKDSYNLRLDKIQYVTPPNNTEGKRTRLEENDLLISITGEVGNLGLIPKDFGEAYINQHTGLVRLNKHIYHLFVANCFLSSFLKLQFDEPQRGLKNSFRLTDIDYLQLPLPPLPEQQRIVKKLDEIMQYCDQLEESIKNSQTQNELLLQQVLREALEPKNN